MKIKDMKIEELEILSYTDLTYMLLKEQNKTMNTPTIFRQICDLLKYSDEDYTAKIGDYYTSLTIDRRFVLLDNGEWDIRDHHIIKLEVDDDEEEEIISEDEEDDDDDEIVPDEEEETVEDSLEDDDLDDDDEELDDLSIIGEDEIEE